MEIKPGDEVLAMVKASSVMAVKGRPGPVEPSKKGCDHAVAALAVFSGSIVESVA